MARCTKCNHKWSLKEVLLLPFSKDGRECSVCKQKQYISSTTQNIMSLSYWSVIIVILFPFIIKLSDKKDGDCL